MINIILLLNLCLIFVDWFKNKNWSGGWIWMDWRIKILIYGFILFLTLNNLSLHDTSA